MRPSTRLLLFAPRRFEACVLWLILLALSFICIFQFFRLGTIGFISDSEIWSVTLAKHYGEDFLHPWVLSRPLFYGLLALAVAPFHDPVFIFSAAKAVCLANGLLLLFLVFRFARTLTDPEAPSRFWVPWLSVLVLVTNSGFINQGYRIRSDLFACSLVLLAMERTFRFLRKPDEAGEGRKRLLLDALWLAPFLATPKAALQILPALPILFMIRPWSGLSRREKKIADIVLVTLLVLLFPAIRWSLGYFFESFVGSRAQDGSSLYFSKEAFFYAGRILTANPLFSGALIVRTICVAFRLKWNAFRTPFEKSLHVKFLIYCALILIVALLAPERHPFLLASLMPPLAIFCALLADDLLEFQKRIRPQMQWRFLVGLGMTLGFVALDLSMGSWARYKLCAERDTDRDQFAMIRYLDSYLSTYSKATFYDAIGILPDRTTTRRFVGPNDKVANDTAWTWIQSDHPDLIFYTNKLHLLEPKLGRFLSENYSSIDQGVYARWENVTTPIPVTPSSLAALREQVARLQQSVGAPASAKLRFQLKYPDGSIKITDTTVDLLLANENTQDKGGKSRTKTKRTLANKKRRAVIEKISPFSELQDPPPLQMPTLFAFDFEY